MNKLKKLKQELKSTRGVKDILDEDLKNLLFSRFIFTSSVIEGIVLKKSDITKIIHLKQDSVNEFKVPHNADFLQALGQKMALELIEEWAKEKQIISTQYLLRIHNVMLDKIDPLAGNYRKTFVKLRSSALMPSFPYMISAEMNDLDRWLKDQQETLDIDDIEAILNLVTKAYHEITRIHPFTDGNGRSGRLFITLLLRRYNLPHIFIPKVINDKRMKQVLRAADMGNIQLLNNFISLLLEDSMQRTIIYWRGKLE